MSSIRGTSWQILMYEESCPVDFFEKLVTYNHMYILHDKDVNDSGEVKKKHIHIAIKTHQMRISTLANDLGIEERFISVWHDHRKNVRYLLHLDNADKFHYSKEEITTNAQEWLKWLDYEATPLDVLDLLQEERPHNYRELITVITKAGLWGIFRSNASLFIEAWKEIKYETATGNGR